MNIITANIIPHNHIHGSDRSKMLVKVCLKERATGRVSYHDFIRDKAAAVEFALSRANGSVMDETTGPCKIMLRECTDADYRKMIAA